MNEKRFTMIDHNEYAEGDCIYYDNGEELGSLDVLDKLNEQHEKIEFVSLLANHRGEMIAFANSLIQDLDDETEKEMWETFKEEMWQKWIKYWRLMKLTKYKITGTFKVIYEDTDEENAIMQCMENYLGALSDECDDCFKSVEFEFYDCEELKEK